MLYNSLYFYLISMDFRDLIDQVKEEINRTEDLTDLCDVACEKLSEKLKFHNISGKIINGKVTPKWLNGEKFEYFHYWIEVGEKILDPTNEQFGLKNNLFNKDDEIYSLYEEVGEVKSF